LRPEWPNNALESRFIGAVISTIERDHACITISGSTINVISIVIFSLDCELGTNTDIRRSKVNAPKDKKNAPASESESKRRKRNKAKLIRLSDLIPEKDVKGGHQVLFGVSDTNPKNK
jgi:hypothetical protein